MCIHCVCEDFQIPKTFVILAHLQNRIKKLSDVHLRDSSYIYVCIVISEAESEMEKRADTADISVLFLFNLC